MPDKVIASTQVPFFVPQHQLGGEGFPLCQPADTKTWYSDEY
jgi:hypothetical protein